MTECFLQPQEHPVFTGLRYSKTTTYWAGHAWALGAGAGTSGGPHGKARWLSRDMNMSPQL